MLSLFVISGIIITNRLCVGRKAATARYAGSCTLCSTIQLQQYRISKLRLLIIPHFMGFVGLYVRLRDKL